MLPKVTGTRLVTKKLYQPSAPTRLVVAMPASVSLPDMTGLLAATDIIRRVKEKLRSTSYDLVVMPAVIFNYNGYSLDGFSSERIRKNIGVPVRVVESVGELLQL